MNKQDYRAARRLIRDNGIAHGLKWMPAKCRPAFVAMGAASNDHLALRLRWNNGTCTVDQRAMTIRLTTPNKKVTK